MSQPLVSIIIPCYNAERWLASTLESALAQTWPAVEIIVINDGSTDGSVVVARSFAARGVQVVTQANAGAAAARNTGLRLARGDYIQFLDADDLLAPTKVAAQIAIADGDGQLLTFGSAIHFDDGGALDRGLFHAANLAPSLHVPVEFLIDLLGGNGQGWMVQTGQWLLPRRLADLAGDWDESLSVDDDGEYFCRVMLAAREVRPVPAAVCYYRKFARGGNLSSQWLFNSRGAASQLAATQLKARWLGRATQDPRLTTALASSYSTIVLSSYPVAPAVSATAEAELRQLGRPLEIKDVTLWFRRLERLGGWRFARRVQHLVLRARQILRPT